MMTGARPVRMRQSVFPELHVQRAVQAVLPPGGFPPVTAHQRQQVRRLRRPARDAVADGPLPAAVRQLALGLHPDQAAQTRPLRGVRDGGAEAAQHRADAPFAPPAVVFHGLAGVRDRGLALAPVGGVEGRLDVPVQVLLVALERQQVVAAARMQGLCNGPPATRRVDGDDGIFEGNALQQGGGMSVFRCSWSRTAPGPRSALPAREKRSPCAGAAGRRPHRPCAATPCRPWPGPVPAGPSKPEVPSSSQRAVRSTMAASRRRTRRW